MLCAADLRTLAQLIPDAARLVMISGGKDAVQETVSVQTASVRSGDVLQVCRCMCEFTVSLTDCQEASPTPGGQPLLCWVGGQELSTSCYGGQG